MKYAYQLVILLSLPPLGEGETPCWGLVQPTDWGTIRSQLTDFADAAGSSREVLKIRQDLQGCVCIWGWVNVDIPVDIDVILVTVFLNIKQGDLQIAIARYWIVSRMVVGSPDLLCKGMTWESIVRFFSFSIAECSVVCTNRSAKL